MRKNIYICGSSGVGKSTFIESLRSDIGFHGFDLIPNTSKILEDGAEDDPVSRQVAKIDGSFDIISQVGDGTIYDRSFVDYAAWGIEMFKDSPSHLAKLNSQIHGLGELHPEIRRSHISFLVPSPTAEQLREGKARMEDIRKSTWKTFDPIELEDRMVTFREVMLIMLQSSGMKFYDIERGDSIFEWQGSIMEGLRRAIQR